MKWDEFVNHLEQRWNQSGPELYQVLVNVIKYAILTPLGLVTTAVEILKDDEQTPPPVRNWAQECYQACQSWIDNYYEEIHVPCLAGSDDSERNCKCILQAVETLFANSPGLLVRGSEFQRLELDEHQKTLFGILLKKLSTITQIHNELQEQNLSWLLTYIDEGEQARMVQ